MQGLGYLAGELRYDREHAQDDDLDMPFLRWRSAQLALSLAKQGAKDAPAVSQCALSKSIHSRRSVT